jgi:hypothetical protein
MGELLAVTCDSCGEPMVPNVSTLDDDGCGWICLNPGCPELAAGELEAEHLVEAGVPEALAGRLARLVDHYLDAEEARGREADAPAWARERAQAGSYDGAPSVGCHRYAAVSRGRITVHESGRVRGGHTSRGDRAR